VSSEQTVAVLLSSADARARARSDVRLNGGKQSCVVTRLLVGHSETRSSIAALATDRLWGTLSLLFDGYLAGKAAGA
jgi:hypothetical protein